MILNGHNLGERHRDFNSKVSEAVTKRTNFEDLKSQPENCDVDKLFKIDLASKYKNIDYILEVLKCGDVFYISRALKCIWMYQDEYSQFINTDYLDTNVFPNMSRKIKKKMLTAISMHVRDTDRVINFHKYCIEARLNDLAVKFSLFTPDDYKLNLLKTKYIRTLRDVKVLKQFIGNSIELAQTYVAIHHYSDYIIQELRFLYSVSEEEYLNILEQIYISASCPHLSRRLGIRISKNIIHRHKQRVLNKPVLYINILHKGMLVKHLAREDVESLAYGLLPNGSREYWSLNFYSTYKFILEKIPTQKLYGFMRQIFLSEYKNEKFEMNVEFYNLQYYEMLNIDEREAWALQHIEQDKELPGIKNYVWYKFVSFDKAFSGIKRYIFLTPDKDERSRIVNVLPDTARNEKDIIEILRYYYERHVNESESHKESFLNKIIEVLDIYSFSNECWTIFDKLLYSLDVYTTGSYTRWEYKFRSLIYHILHDKELPEGLKEYFEQITYFHDHGSLIQELTEQRKATVAKYFLSNCAEKIESLMCHPDYNKENEDDTWDRNSIKYQIQSLVNRVWSAIDYFQRPHEDCPHVVIKYMEANMDIYKHYEYYKVKFEKKSEEDFVRWLKQDIKMVVNGISEIRCNTYRWNFRLCRLFRKLKVYFPNDVAKEYLKYFMEYLSDVPRGRREYRNIKMAVVGVYYLADRESIISFLEKYVPTSPKIDHGEIDNRVLQVQKAICRLAYHPRPPLPLPVIHKYVCGDYVHYCLPMFNNYFASLPSTTQFIDRLLDCPVSIQKHGLRLAFRSYDAETLLPIIINAWKKTKNVSLRMVLFVTLFNRILEEKHEDQEKLYEVLKLYTSELNHDDHDDVYSLLVSKEFPDAFKGNFIETAWITVSKLPDKSVDIRRRTRVIEHMEKYIHLVRRDFVRLQIIEDHIKNTLQAENFKQRYVQYEIQELIDAKWQLTAKYIVSFNDEVEQQISLQLLQTIMNFFKFNISKVRKFMDEFIEIIMNKDPKTIERCADVILVYQYILDSLRSFLIKEEMYLLNWKLKLSIMLRNYIRDVIKGNEENMTCWIIGDAYGEIAAKIVRKSVRSNDFARSMCNSIAGIVNNVIRACCETIDMEYSGGFVYLVCEGLIKTKMTETHLLALAMMPKHPVYDWEDEHDQIMNEIKKYCVSSEVLYFLYEKFVL